MSSGKPYFLTGGCLCQAVRYQIHGVCRDVINCHCENCRRTHGHYAAYLSTEKKSLDIKAGDTLHWYDDQGPGTRRGFCRDCGSSLFWDRGSNSHQISVSAGTLDDSDELKTIGHVFVSEAGRYYRIDDDLPRYDKGNQGKLELD